MKAFWVVIFVLLVSLGYSFAQQKVVLKNQKDRFSYSIGANMATNLKRQSVDIDWRILVKGFEDVYSGGKALMSEDEVLKTMQELEAQMRAKQQETAKTAGEKNKKAGDAFLAANKQKEGVVTLPSGLQYKILKAGSGPKPNANQTVTAHYRGTFINGKEFDNSYKRGKPITTSASAVIKGWSEALQLMPVGSKWQLFIPSDLAYGPAGKGPQVGPNETLIFEVELLSAK